MEAGEGGEWVAAAGNEGNALRQSGETVDVSSADGSNGVDSFLSELRLSLQRQGKTLREVNVKVLAESLARGLPADDETNQLLNKVGPYYDTRGLQEWLRLSRQALRKRAKAHKLLACKTDDNVLLYPVWQFLDDGSVLPHLDEVLTILASGSPEAPWSWGAWLTAVVDDELDGKSAAQWLRDGYDPESVKALAREDAASWAA
ncbi:hypothetical protein [Arthrobacter castelli]|uniref:hypothetical protein n=1 Tax=Arthrobacter castelli TaxID=271431 RepID=UPI00040CCA99|nr:hypothetical protein [Arthrobacter castelli]